MRYCLRPNCGIIVARGSYCDRHRRQQAHARRNSNARGYTWQWGKRAKAFLDRHPLCGQRPGGVAPVMSQCHVDGIRTPATQVDHVIPHRGNPILFDDELGNWQALCARCGARKSRSEM